MLQVADRDLNFCRVTLDMSEIDDAVWGFHAQQATEKLLKSLIATHRAIYPFTHSLDALFQQLTSLGRDLPAFRELIVLESFAVRLRYASPDVDDDPLERTSIISRIEELRHLVVQSIENASHA